jgi:hypothetical protein
MKFSKYIAIVFFYSYWFPVANSIRRSETDFPYFWHFMKISEEIKISGKRRRDRSKP